MSAKSTRIGSEAGLNPAQSRSDKEIDAAIATDPDWADLEPIDWAQAEIVVPPKKQAISIRLDQDLIDYFKSEGPGYQRRINAVLRSYVRQRKAG